MRGIMKQKLADFFRDPVLPSRYAEEAARHLADSALYTECPLLLAFMSAGAEINTLQCIAGALADGKRAAVPLISGQDMDFFYLLPGVPLEEQLAAGSFGIREPKKENGAVPVYSLPPGTLILAPGLAFTAEGVRLGRGGGYYDRFLKNIFRHGDNRPEVMGFCFDFQIVHVLPSEEHDQKAGYLLTEKGIISC